MTVQKIDKLPSLPVIYYARKFGVPKEYWPNLKAIFDRLEAGLPRC